MTQTPFVAVVGAVNVDIWGCGAGKLRAADSNPGRVRTSLGGVGRNIACNLRLLGVEVTLLTAFGDDNWGRLAAERCRAAGIDLSGALYPPGERSSAYVYLTDSAGELALAVCDAEILRRLTPAVLQRHLPLLNRAALVVMDGNLEAETIAFLAERCTAPLFADPVSVEKGKKLLPVLPKLHTLKPNALEAMSLTGETTPEAAAFALHRRGVREVYVSCGGEGLVVARTGHTLTVPPVPAKPINVTGGGDAVMAALCRCTLDNASPIHTARYALTAGALAVESPETVNPTLSHALVGERMQKGENP